MLSTVMSLALLGQVSGATPSKIVDASLFKNGYAVLTHEMTVPASGVINLEEIPQGRLGTVWVSSDSRTKITSVVLTKSSTKNVTEVSADSMGEVLKLNKGKTATLTLLTTKGEEYKIDAKIVEVQGSLLVVDEAGTRHFLPLSALLRFSLPDGVYSRKIESTKESPVLKISATAGGKVYIMALQRGMMWSPAYNLELMEKGKVKIIGKATIINELGDLMNQDVKLITGFPNIRYADLPDPLTDLSTMGRGADAMLGAAAKASQVPMQNMAFARRESGSPGADFYGSFEETATGGEMLEDLYFYTQPKVNLKKGDRGYFVMFSKDTDFNHIYTLNLNEGEDNPEVWHEIKFKNNVDMPLTTGPAVVMQKGEIIGQDELKYTSNGADAFLKISKALDISAAATSEEITRERGAIKDRYNNPAFDLVTVKGTVELINRKGEDVTMEITKDVEGELTEASNGGKIVKTAKRLNSQNINSRVVWTPTLKKGGKLTLTYTYQVYIASR
ncbi:MAG: hypothetical protein KDC26_04590 [Armatimonadetes bacterium]|nr:hypothetical protein [Armatimonadota bacterium]